jgi:flagellar biosynthesis/type III secretory pathway chaperone
MKVFNHLTIQQRRQAVREAMQVLRKHIQSGLIIPQKELSNEEILNLAIVAAEESIYTGNGKILFEMGGDLPTAYIGGNV